MPYAKPPPSLKCYILFKLLKISTKESFQCIRSEIVRTTRFYVSKMVNAEYYISRNSDDNIFLIKW